MPIERIEQLQRMPIFGALSREALELLLGSARMVHVAANEFFFREDDAGECLYVLERGRVAVLKRHEGRELLLGELREGDCFGEMALLDLAPRSASVQAREDCSAIELTAGNLYGLFNRHSEQFTLLQMNIAREISRRLRSTDAKLSNAGKAGEEGEGGGLSSGFRPGA